MNSRIAVASGLVAVLAAIFTVPLTAFAADVPVDITAGSISKTDDAYSPNPVQANVGDTVIWTNRDTTLHTATSGTASGGPTNVFGGNLTNPVLIAPSQTMSFTFSEAGEFPYYCTLHPNMIGTVIVGGDGPTPIESTASATLDGNTYEVSATSETSTATGLEIDPDEKSVTVIFDTAGEAELTLPKTMIDGVVEGEGVSIIETTDTATRVSVVVPEGETEVDIMGSFVVPEFPVIAALVLGITIAAIAGYTRFSKGSLSGFSGRV
ncbi:MAG TPA: plastocyanin/azurin family copper-binding protein [Nitrososphaera sp.]|jgi:plastocyanin|nr:plastocyanin/azurin family copper-binding protein [Nitrososphaera sp.]